MVLQEREAELPEDIQVEDGVIIMKEEGEVKFNMEEDRVSPIEVEIVIIWQGVLVLEVIMVKFIHS